MQSQRKNSGSYFDRQQSVLFHNTKNNYSWSKKKLSTATQTENFPNFLKDIRLCNFSIMSMEEIKENYTRTLYFLNYCHDFMNKMFGESVDTFGNSKLERVFDFRVPEVPNYFSVMEMFLQKGRPQIADPRYNKTDNSNKITRNNIKNDVRDGETGGEQTIFDLQQFIPKNIGDGPSSLINQTSNVMRLYDEEPSQSKLRNSDNVRMDIASVKGARKRPSTSPSRLVKSEKDMLKKQTRSELKALSTAFEEILKNCNEFEWKSRENLLKQDVPLEFYHQSPREKGVISAKGDQKTQRKTQEMIMNTNYQTLNEEQNILSQEKNIDPLGNVRDLIEYALKNLKEPECESDLPTRSLNHKPQVNSESLKMIQSKGLLTENLSFLLLNNIQDISSTNKKSYTILNEAYQTKSPKKVNEMFKKISTEKLRTSEKATSSCSDSGTFIKFMDNDNFSDEYGREYPSQAFIENSVIGNASQNSGGIRMTSSSDSVILTDEEFEKKNRNAYLLWNKERGNNSNEEEQCKNGRIIKNGFLEQEIIPPMKSHPFKLTDKDRSLTDQKTLQTIGLFTEKGDIRPGVINLLEEKQRMSFTQNPAKNVQFRTKRKLDVKIHYNNNNKTKEGGDKKQVEKHASKESLSPKSITDPRTGSTLSLHSSAVTFSSSTVSDSDLLSMEPNGDQTVIKKFE